MHKLMFAAMGVCAAVAADGALAQEKPPQVTLGARVREYQNSWTPLATVVVVSDARSYLEAIASWTPARRFPVLIDLGDDASRENIARFVRAYAPKHIVRWTAPADSPTKSAGVGEASFANCDAGEVRAVLGRALSMSTPPADDGAIIARFKELKHTPPGVVFAQTADPAWTGAVALAAGRGQPLVFINGAKNFGGAYNPEGAAALVATIDGAVAATGYSWDKLGDEIEAITLATNLPVKFDPGGGAKDRLALTDRIGRHGDGDRKDKRWAWCGQIPGNSAGAAYRAMCSLFLVPRSGWLFDGYEPNGEWNEYDCTKAGATLSAAGLAIETMDTPSQGANDWRMRTARPMNAGLVLITTKGNNNYFELQPGTCTPGDLPMLNLPAVVHIVHSWSAQQPDDRATIAGRWLERGVYAYFGSVDEPFLRAFVPTPQLANRLTSGAPFVVAARLDGGKVWKTASIADPLMVLGEVKDAIDEPPPLVGAVTVGETLRDLLKDNKFAEAIGVLTLQGRDEEVVKLVRALTERQPARITPEVARAALLPFFRCGDNRAVIDMFKKLDAPSRREGEILDALWLAAYPLIAAKDQAVMDLLAQNTRPDQADKDRALLAK